MSGLIIWHYHKNGIVVNSVTEYFEGSVAELEEKTDDNFMAMERKTSGEAIKIFHGFVGE